jgi:hypothetical protein
MSNESIHIEPTAPVPPPFKLSSRDKPFIGPIPPAAADLVGPETPTQNQGERQREQDHKDWLQDMEDRKARSAGLAEKRRQQEANTKKDVDVVAELDAALEALDAGATDSDQTHGKPNEPLIAAKLEVDRLRSELAAAEAKLAEIEARGGSVDRLRQTVSHGESALNGLLSAAESQALRALIEAKFGWEVRTQKIQRETIKELTLDVSIQSLRQFSIQPHRHPITDVATLQHRM